MAGIQSGEQLPYDEHGTAPVGVPSTPLSAQEHNWLLGPYMAGEHGQPGEVTTQPLSGEPNPLQPASPIVPGSAAA